MGLTDDGYSAHGAKVWICEPSTDAEDVEIDGPEDRLEKMEVDPDVVEKGESGYVESMQFYGGHLHIRAWTGPGRGDGWMTFVRIPMLAKASARTEVEAMAKPYGISSGRFDDVAEILELDVDDYGRVNLGKERAGDTVKLAVIDE